MAEKKDPIRSLIENGRRAGKLTNSEISDAMEESGHILDVEQMEKLYEELEGNGIEVIDDDPVTDVDPSLLGEGQYFFYVDVFDGVLTQAVCLDKPVTEFAFEVTSGDLTMPEWAPGWGRIHFPPVKLVQE